MPKFGDIFEWVEWDDLGIEIYYDCVLMKDVGEFKKGEPFDNIQFDRDTMRLYFYKEEGDEDDLVMVRNLTCN